MTKKNILIYAFGMGLGHLNRIICYLDQHDIDPKHCTIVTNSRYLDYLPIEMHIQKFSVGFFADSALFFSKFKQLVETLDIQELLIDVYPSGFYGELSNLNTFKIKKTLLARVLKHNYFRKNPLGPLYNNVVVVEKGVVTSNYQYQTLAYCKLDLVTGYSLKKLVPKYPFFLILHSGPPIEVVKLYKKALGQRKHNEHIYIQTFCRLENLENLPFVTIIFRDLPVKVLLDECQILFTGCGFNTFWTTESYREKQQIIPFVRGFDDQFRRKRIADKHA